MGWGGGSEGGRPSATETSEARETGQGMVRNAGPGPGCLGLPTPLTLSRHKPLFGAVPSVLWASVSSSVKWGQLCPPRGCGEGGWIHTGPWPGGNSCSGALESRKASFARISLSFALLRVPCPIP